MKKVNILSLLIIFAGISVIDIRAAARSSTKRNRTDYCDENNENLQKPRIEEERKVNKEELNKQFIDAVEANNFDQVKEALDKGADIDSQGKFNLTALMLTRDLKILTLLLLNKIDVNATAFGETAISFACAEGNIKVARLLIEHGADLNAKNDLNIPLLVASKTGNTDVIKLLLDNKADINIQSDKGTTALMVACMNNKLEAAKLLIEKGANVNLEDSEGLTALMLAAANDNIDIVRLLLENKADVLAENKLGRIALDFVNDNPELEKLLTDVDKATELVIPTLVDLKFSGSESSESKEPIKVELTIPK